MSSPQTLDELKKRSLEFAVDHSPKMTPRRRVDAIGFCRKRHETKTPAPILAAQLFHFPPMTVKDQG